MTVPVEGPNNAIPNQHSPATAHEKTQPDQKAFKATSADPVGIWTRFLSQTGAQAQPEEVEAFIRGLEKTLQMLIQQQKQAAQRMKQRMREAIDGG